MPEVKVEIGGRDFAVVCQEGEERFLEAAARLLDAEARTVMGQTGRLPEARMLLMAGLMLADRTAAVDDHLRTLEAKLAVTERALAEARATPRLQEVPVVPVQVVETLAELAARAESLADQLEAG